MKTLTLDHKILKLLLESSEQTSGDKLARALGVSRVAVWKSIQRLRAKGYKISINRKGYLLEDKDILLQEELEHLTRQSTLFQRVYLYHEIPSTMDVARELAEKGINALVIAERQSAGRGRLGRHWESEKGGLWLTLVLRVPFSLDKSFLLTYLSGLACARALERAYNLQPKLKWPNDILLGERKVGGILIEIKAEVDLITYALIGIGINVNNRVADREFEIPAVSVSEFLGRNVTRLPLLENLIGEFQELILKEDLIIEEWKRYSETLGKKVRIITSGEIIEGLALDIDEKGALLLRTEDGTVKRVFSGDCYHIR